MKCAYCHRPIPKGEGSVVENGKDHHYWCAMVMRGDNKHGIKVDPEGKRSVYMFPSARSYLKSVGKRMWS